VLDDRRTHDLRNRRQTGGLRDRIFLGAQITAEDRRARCRDALQPLFRPKGDPTALDAVEINRTRLTLALAQRSRCRSFPEQWQSLMFPDREPVRWTTPRLDPLSCRPRLVAVLPHSVLSTGARMPAAAPKL
jgi:hypothetical protein